jgi:hypothetical protein
MADIPEWLTDEGIERTMVLGREMEVFLKRREKAKAIDPNGKVEPHPELLALYAGMRAKHDRRPATVED